MDPMTMLAIAQFGAKMMQGNQPAAGGSGGQQQDGGMQQQQQRPITPGQLPQPIAAPMPYGAAINGGMPQNPMMANPMMAQMLQQRPAGM